MKLSHHCRGLVIFLGLFCFCSLSAQAFQAVTPTETNGRPDLLLLKPHDVNQEVAGWLMSEKLDGVRAYWNGKQLLSRNGHVFAVPDWFTENFPPFELDGELWLERGMFEDTVSIVRKKTPHDGWRAVSYQIFEVPNQVGGLLERLAVLKAYLVTSPAPYLNIIKQIPIQSNAEVPLHLKRIVDLKGEGLVLRNPDSLYYSGRSKEAVKVKLKQDAECVVTAYTAGKGKYLGMTGALKCELSAKQFPQLQLQNALEIKIGSGLSDSQRANPPTIGSLVTFQYMGLTDKGLPRFPVLLRVRGTVDDLKKGVLE